MDELDLHPADAHAFDEGGEEGVHAGPGVEGGVDEVDPDDAEGVLLAARVLVPQPQVQEHLAGRAERRLLKAQADPGMPLALAVVRGGRDRVGEGEEAGLRPALGGQTIDQQLVLVLQHLLQALARDVTLGMAVDGVADPHVVGRHALGDGARGTPGLEEMADDLLPRPDLGERAVGGTVEVDGQRLAFGGRARIRGLLVHAVNLTTPATVNQRKPASKKRLLNGDVSPGGHRAETLRGRRHERIPQIPPRLGARHLPRGRPLRLPAAGAHRRRAERLGRRRTDRDRPARHPTRRRPRTRGERHPRARQSGPGRAARRRPPPDGGPLPGARRARAGRQGPEHPGRRDRRRDRSRRRPTGRTPPGHRRVPQGERQAGLRLDRERQPGRILPRERRRPDRDAPRRRTRAQGPRREQPVFRRNAADARDRGAGHQGRQIQVGGGALPRRPHERAVPRAVHPAGAGRVEPGRGPDRPIPQAHQRRAQPRGRRRRHLPREEGPGAQAGGHLAAARRIHRESAQGGGGGRRQRDVLPPGVAGALRRQGPAAPRRRQGGGGLRRRRDRRRLGRPRRGRRRPPGLRTAAPPGRRPREGRGAAGEQPGRLRLRQRPDRARGRPAPQERPARRRLHGRPRGQRRLLHRRARERDHGRPGHHHRLHRRLRPAVQLRGARQEVPPRARRGEDQPLRRPRPSPPSRRRRRTCADPVYGGRGLRGLPQGRRRGPQAGARRRA